MLNNPPKLYRNITVGILGLAIILGYAFFIFGKQGIYWDAGQYYRLGEQIGKNGLFNFHDRERTYGYPLFLSLIWLVSDHSPTTVRWLVFNAQLAIFLSVCYFAFHVVKSHFKNLGWSLVLLMTLALNPFLLIYTGVLLSDLFSALIIYVALLFSLQTSTPRGHGQVGKTGNRIIQADNWWTFVSFFMAGCAVMVRPANLTISLAVIGAWGLRWFIFKEGSRHSPFLMLVGYIIPFVPQIVNNYVGFGQFQPLIVRSLYDEQLTWGMQYLKYGTIVIPSEPNGAVFYYNPFYNTRITSITEFLTRQPVEFFLTQAIHIFALFDHDYSYPYITNVNDWSRFVFAIINFTFLFGIVSGILTWLPRLIRPKIWDRLDLLLATMLLGISAYLPTYIMTAVEPRFSLPIYFLASPFFVYALRQIINYTQQKQLKTLGAYITALALFVGLCLSLSQWLWMQAPLLGELSKNPDAAHRIPLQSTRTHLGDRVQLLGVGYEIDHTNQRQVWDKRNILFLVLKWMCNGASTEQYDIQFKLMDDKERVWSLGEQRYQERISPCRGWLWGNSDPVTEVVLFRLPITMPAGEYHSVISFYDPVTNTYVSAIGAGGEQLDNVWSVATLPIAKNKSAATADQIYIENRFFVDMAEMRLLGYSNVPDNVISGANFDVGLYWRARTKPRGDYQVVIQIRNDAKQIVFEQTNRPAENTYPTTQWDAGEVLLDWHAITLPETIKPGEYGLTVSLRDITNSQLLGETELFHFSVTP